MEQRCNDTDRGKTEELRESMVETAIRRFYV
jgi:hypothetical protein